MISLQHLLSLISISIGLVAFALGYPQRHHVPTKPKVFVIGLTKTGTTSLGDALEYRLNYTRYGWHDIYSRYLVHQVELPKPNLDPVISLSTQFEVLEDIPWCLPSVYTKMSKLYPDAKFVLSLRRSEHIWLESMRRHTRQKLWEGHKQIYGAYRVDDNEEAFLQTYKNHMTEVRKFFATDAMQGRGLEIAIDGANESDESKWKRLTAFLEIGSEQGVNALGAFPKSNGNETWKNRDVFGLVWLSYRLAFVFERCLVDFVDGLGYTTALLA